MDLYAKSITIKLLGEKPKNLIASLEQANVSSQETKSNHHKRQQIDNLSFLKMESQLSSEDKDRLGENVTYGTETQRHMLVPRHTACSTD